MNVFLRHARLSHSEQLEAFNRASHSDALREMQLVEPAEPQSIVGTGTNYLPAMALGLCFVLTCIGVSV